MQWIQHFQKHTATQSVGSRRLLILDNHGSHTTHEFRIFCKAYNITLLWMPPHSLHTLQPMDVSCFGPLKTAFSKQNCALIQRQIYHIIKHDFLMSLRAAIDVSLTSANIQAGFRGAGLYLFDPEAVISRLDPIVHLETNTLPCLQGSQQLRTPYNIAEVTRQATLIQQRIL